MDTTDALHDTFEESGYEVLNLVDLAHLKYLLQLCKEECLLDAVSEGPVAEESLEQGDGQGTVLGEEEHAAAEELLVELGACLHLM
jgi:hypothetical protein